MKRTILLLSAIVILITIAALACTNASAGAEKNSEKLNAEEMVKRGEYLVNSIGCDDCHSPKQMGAHGPEIIPELRLSGYPSSRALQPADINTMNKGWMLFGPDLTTAVGPWGQSFSANITSDETGIGNWSEENFLRAIRHGKYKGIEGSRDLLPPMPWFVYKNMNDEDLKSIFTYLKTTKPVRNIVPAPKTFSELK